MNDTDRAALKRRNDLKVVTLKEVISKLEERLTTCDKADRMGLQQAQLEVIEMIITIRGYDELIKVQ